MRSVHQTLARNLFSSTFFDFQILTATVCISSMFVKVGCCLLELRKYIEGVTFNQRHCTYAIRVAAMLEMFEHSGNIQFTECASIM